MKNTLRNAQCFVDQDEVGNSEFVAFDRSYFNHISPETEYSRYSVSGQTENKTSLRFMFTGVLLYVE